MRSRRARQRAGRAVDEAIPDAPDIDRDRRQGKRNFRLARPDPVGGRAARGSAHLARAPLISAKRSSARRP